MSDTFYVALEGMRNAESRIERSAEIIARGSSPTSSPAPEADSVDISSYSAKDGRNDAAPIDYAQELVQINRAKGDYRANLKVAATQDRLERETLDLLA